MNIELGGIVIGWREALLGLIVLLALYMFVMVWRMRRLRSQTSKPEAQPQPPAAQAEPSVKGGEAEAEPAPDWQATQSRLAQETFMQGIENELAQLRDEVDALRGEVAALRDEMWQEVGHMRASQTVSPLYNDAMQMAQLGHDPATIAERCGIARAEAELVVALVKSQNN
ncbi:MAG TPA: DUF2802 domain-containing protein [Rhodocyclaceae bacterium]|nr:DUF2802 domain-containing protein [Rhodocyclaceae bacterium]